MEYVIEKTRLEARLKYPLKIFYRSILSDPVVVMKLNPPELEFLVTEGSYSAYSAVPFDEGDKGILLDFYGDE